MTGIDLTRAYVVATGSDANMAGANLTGAVMADADVTGADLRASPGRRRVPDETVSDTNGNSRNRAARTWRGPAGGMLAVTPTLRRRWRSLES